MIGSADNLVIEIQLIAIALNEFFHRRCRTPATTTTLMKIPLEPLSSEMIADEVLYVFQSLKAKQKTMTRQCIL